MKKFLLTLSLIFIISFVSAPFCFADGSFVTNTYPFSATFKLDAGQILIVQSKNPIFVRTADKMIVLNGECNFYWLDPTAYVYTMTYNNYTLTNKYSQILESSTDLISYDTREVAFQSEQTDNVVISNQTITDFMTHLTNLTNLSIAILCFIILIFCYFVSNSIFLSFRKG